MLILLIDQFSYTYQSFHLSGRLHVPLPHLSHPMGFLVKKKNSSFTSYRLLILDFSLSRFHVTLKRYKQSSTHLQAAMDANTRKESCHQETSPPSFSTS